MNDSAKSPVEKLREAIAADDLARVDALLAAGTNPNEDDIKEVPPLLLAALLNRTRAAVSLIEHGATYPTPRSDDVLDRYRSAPNRSFSDAIQCAIHFRNRKLFDALLSMPSTIAAFDTPREPSIAWQSALYEAEKGKKWFLHEIMIACAASACGIEKDVAEVARIRKAFNSFIRTVKLAYDSKIDADHFRPAHPFRRKIPDKTAHREGDSQSEVHEVRGVFIAALAEPRANDYAPGTLPCERIERAPAPVYYDDRESQEYTCTNTFIRHRIDDTTLADYTLFMQEDWEHGNRYPLIQGTVFYADTKEAMDAFVATRPSFDVMHDLVASIDRNDGAEFISAVDRGGDLDLENNCRNTAATLAAHYGADQILTRVLELRPDLADELLRPTGPLAKPPLVVVIHQITEHERPNGNCQKYADLLIKHGADLEWADSDGQTPLMIACSKNSLELVKTLLEAGAEHRCITDLSVYKPETQSILGAWRARHAIEDVLASARARASAALA